MNGTSGRRNVRSVAKRLWFTGTPRKSRAFILILTVVAAALIGHLPSATSTARASSTASATIVPYQATAYKYQQVTSGQEPSGWQDPSFDSSGWPTGDAAFGSGGYCALQPTVKTHWDGSTDILVRKQVVLPAGASGVTIGIAVDNDARVYWNGIFVGSATHEGCPAYNDFVFPVSNFLLNEGTNLLAVEGIDRGFQSFLDVTVAGNVAPATNLPVNTAPPSIIRPGGAVDGSRLYSSLGTWTDASSYALTWLRCGGQGCDPVGHDTTYLLGAADIARRMRLRVTAFNGNGSTDATSELTNPVQAAPPLALHLPAISGTFALGSTLTAGTGSWSGTSPLSYLFEWFRCSNAGPCKAIAAATGSSYVVQSADLGNRLRVRVRAANPAGGAWAASSTLPASSNVAPPRNTSLPQLSGTPALGSTMQAGTGAWSGTATIVFSYQWRRCSTLAGTSCTWIVGATGKHYVVTAADQGMRLRALVTATNSVLSNRATSLASPVVT